LVLDKDLQERIRDANVAVHRFEAKYYELIHPEVYNRYEQKRLNSALRMVDRLVADNHGLTKRALDFGAGTGNLTVKLLQMGYEVTAIDISAEMCKILEKKCRSFLESKQLVVINSPIEDFILVDKFDLVSCYSVLHHLPDYVAVIQRLCGFLRKGGVMYLDHEISPFYWKNETIVAAQLVKLVYFHSNPLLNTIYFQIARINVPSLDYALSDYWHRKEHHLDHEQIKRIFEKEKFSFFKRTDYYLKFWTWILNPFFYLYKYSCKPEMSFWVAKK
jgi:2-polyprenyl-3-methyl-5-hydroxy-6-metoxy-1,4-benzoquinol methylase